MSVLYHPTLSSREMAQFGMHEVDVDHEGGGEPADPSVSDEYLLALIGEHAPTETDSIEKRAAR